MRSCSLDVLTQSAGQLTLKNSRCNLCGGVFAQYFNSLLRVGTPDPHYFLCDKQGELANRICEDAAHDFRGSDLVIILLPVGLWFSELRYTYLLYYLDKFENSLEMYHRQKKLPDFFQPCELNLSGSRDIHNHHISSRKREELLRYNCQSPYITIQKIF
jgi:hypothetical protein